MTSPTEVMSRFWALLIEPYLDVESLVAASKTCGSLRAAAIDATSGKIKASAVKIDDWSSIETYEDNRADWQSAAVRMRHYAPSVINAVHFPFLSKLIVSLPPERTVWNGEERLTENAHVVLPMLARKLNDAINLEELALDVNSLLEHEGRLLDDGRVGHPHFYSILGENLARSVGRSGRLKRLKLFNMLDADELQSEFSSAFLAAMVPVVRAGVDCIEEVTVLCGDYPLSEDHHPDASEKFFEALLGLRRLKALRMQLRCVHGPLWNSLVDASAVVGTFPSRSLEEIAVTIPYPIEETTSQPRSIAPFLRMCRDVPLLQSFMFSVPFWDEEGASALNHLFHGKPLLDHLSIDFHGYIHDDESEPILNCLLGFLRSRTTLSGLRVNLTGLGYLDEESDEFWALEKYCQGGQSCLRQGGFRDGYNAMGDWAFVLC